MDFPEVMRATTAWFWHLHDRGVLARRVEVVMVVGADMMKSEWCGIGVAWCGVMAWCGMVWCDGMVYVVSCDGVMR